MSPDDNDIMITIPLVLPRGKNTEIKQMYIKIRGQSI